MYKQCANINWNLGCINKKLLTSGKPCLKNRELVIYHFYSNKKNTVTKKPKTIIKKNKKNN